MEVRIRMRGNRAEKQAAVETRRIIRRWIVTLPSARALKCSLTVDILVNVAISVRHAVPGVAHTHVPIILIAKPIRTDWVVHGLAWAPCVWAAIGLGNSRAGSQTC